MEPELVLLDAGGVFVLPEPARVLGAYTRAECAVTADILAEAHYRAARIFDTGVDVEADWAPTWMAYMHAYIEACGVAADVDDEAHRHLDSEFAEAALWLEPDRRRRRVSRRWPTPGCALGIVSNADGIMGQRLRPARDLPGRAGPGRRDRVRHRLGNGRDHEARPPHLRGRPRRHSASPPGTPGTSATCPPSTWWAPAGPGCVRS